MVCVCKNITSFFLQKFSQKTSRCEMSTKVVVSCAGMGVGGGLGDVNGADFVFSSMLTQQLIDRIYESRDRRRAAEA